MRIPVIENDIPFVQLTLEFRYVNLCRETDIVTVPAFRRLRWPKSTVRRAVRAPTRAMSPFSNVRAGFYWNTLWECTTLSMMHLSGKTIGSGTGTTTTVPRGGPRLKDRRRKG